MDDELRAEEAHVAVGLLAVVHIALRSFHRFVVGVEGVTGGMRAHETVPFFHVVKQRLLALFGHRRVLVRAVGAEVASGVEEHRVELSEVVLAELGAVLGEGEFPALLVAQFLKDLLSVAWLATLPGNDRVLVAARLGKEQDPVFLRSGNGERSGHDDREQGQRGKDFLEHGRREYTARRDLAIRKYPSLSLRRPIRGQTRTASPCSP